jgi:hypothetical protein
MYLQNKYTTWYNNIIATAKSRVLSKEIYTESHHIIPRSLGGDNHPSNLVKLTAREHRLAHILLPQMTIDPNHTKSMWYAAWMILRTKNKDQSRTISKGKAYELTKIKIAEFSSQLHKGKIVSAETRAKQSAKAKGRVSPNKDRPMSEEQKQKLSVAHKGKSIAPETVAKILETRKNYKHSEETKQKISAGNKGKQVIISEETKQKISIALKGRPNANKGKPAFNLGVPHSTETKEKIRLAAMNRTKVPCLYCKKDIVPSMYARWHGDKCKMKSF